MARGGINRVLVQKARVALLARGLNPSIDAIRIELGNTGSKSTIHRYLKELNNQPSPPLAPTLCDELQHLIQPLAERLRDLAEISVAADREALAHQRQEQENQWRYRAEQLEQLRCTNEALNHRVQEQGELEHQLRAQLHRTDSERLRLAEIERGLREVLAERAGQLQSLEEKHRHAREALEHYRQQQLIQRDQELQRHDLQVRQLQLELNSLRENLLAKQAELASLNRDNERLLVELRNQGQQAYELERAHADLQQKLLAAAQSHKQELSEIANTLSVSREQNLKLRECWKRHLADYRHSRREVQTQRQQLTSLQAALERLSLQHAPDMPPSA
ncbi:DNA-binding protein [Pseudomonas aeruginosa]